MDITKRFYSSDDLIAYIHRFEKENYQLFQISDNKYFHPKNPVTKYKYVVIKCIHHVSPENGRPKSSAHYDAKGCPCFYRINFNTKNGYYEFTKCYPEHNHETSREAFEGYSRWRELSRGERDRFSTKANLNSPKPKIQSEPGEVTDFSLNSPKSEIDKVEPTREVVNATQGLLQLLFNTSKETFEQRVRCIVNLKEIWESGCEAEILVKSANGYEETSRSSERAAKNEENFNEKKQKRKSAPKKIENAEEGEVTNERKRKRQASVDSGSDESAKFSGKDSDMDTQSFSMCQLCKNESSSDLIECNSCGDSYHVHCLNLASSDTIWFCQNCDY